MKWEHNLAADFRWSAPISNQQAKEEVARMVAQRVQDGDVIGFGSGSTSFVAIHAIAEEMARRGIRCTAIPTSAEVEIVCASVGIPTTDLLRAKPDWAFDGADEVDPERNLIKGRGGAMTREKLIIDISPRTYILVDQSKLVEKLGKKFPVPIEITPHALNWVAERLEGIGASKATLRLGIKKDGPVITEGGNFILDVNFAEIGPGLEREIKLISGVIESGLVQGRRLEVLVSRS